MKRLDDAVIEAIVVLFIIGGIAALVYMCGPAVRWP